MTSRRELAQAILDASGYQSPGILGDETGEGREIEAVVGDIVDAILPFVEDGQTIHDGRHFYVSTYCQHARELDGRAIPSGGALLHYECRRTCKTCDAPCLCDAPGCPCREARNRSNVDPENPTHVQENDMARKADPPPDSNRGQGKQGDKTEGQTDKDFYEKQAGEANNDGNGGR